MTINQRIPLSAWIWYLTPSFWLRCLLRAFNNLFAGTIHVAKLSPVNTRRLSEIEDINEESSVSHTSDMPHFNGQNVTDKAPKQDSDQLVSDAGLKVPLLLPQVISESNAVHQIKGITDDLDNDFVTATADGQTDEQAETSTKTDEESHQQSKPTGPVKSKNSVDHFMNSIRLEIEANDSVYYDEDHNFKHLSLRDLGDSKNSTCLQELHTVAVSETESTEDRCQAVRWMLKVPRVNSDELGCSAVKSMLDSNEWTWRAKHFFISNNEKHIRLNYSLVNFAHAYLWNNRYRLELPDDITISVCQFLINKYPQGSDMKLEAEDWLSVICLNFNYPYDITAKAADVLLYNGSNDCVRTLGHKTIERLGHQESLDNRDLSFYNDAQNSHNKMIQESALSALKRFSISSRHFFNMTNVYEEIIAFCALHNEYDLEVIRDSFQNLLTDSHSYAGYRLIDVLEIVYGEVHKLIRRENADKGLVDVDTNFSENALYKSLFGRLMQELQDMKGICSSGLLCRLVNVLSGYVDFQVIKISADDQLKANLYHKLDNVLKNMPEAEERDLWMEKFTGPLAEREDLKTMFMQKVSQRDIMNDFSDSFLPDQLDKNYNDILNCYCGIVDALK